ncbi:MAG: ABC-F family ATP-binding cassette domain-containing protein, partial [Deltaproteobacteria bacterium]|nr:ABC-F family ATP-binding cassette domain-containing protein [Deltaproteobacteria bacterium]
MLISTHQLSKTYGALPLFSGLTFTISDNDRIGLIGPNGAGKSTLLKILAGQITSYEGNISKKQGLSIGYLEQTPIFTEGKNIFDSIMEGALDPDDWQLQSQASEYISKMGLNAFAETTTIETLSGGWKKRVALARELIKKPNVLLLDEPTNHMDIEGITWLENFLSAVRFAVVTITHDRLFLQRVSNRIIEINPRHEGGLLNVQGDYMKYIEIRDQLILSQEKREVILKNTLRRETAWLKAGVKARTTKQKARIQQAGTLKTQVENLTQRNIDQTARLAFVGAEKLPKRLIEVSHLSKKYKDHTIFENLTLTIGPGSRIGLIGKNGAGKSTLIRTLLSTEKASAGKVFHADQLQVAYFDQNREDLDLEQTLSNAICPDGDHVQYNGNMIHVRSYLDRFLFTKQQYDMKVGTLSGGEQSRLLVARLMLQPANLLILDEPTNDLDIATLNVLEQCLQDFPGAIILVSHDRYFLDQISNQL